MLAYPYVRNARAEQRTTEHRWETSPVSELVVMCLLYTFIVRQGTQNSVR